MRAAVASWRERTSSEGGFTLVEILVSALILVLLSMAVLGALDTTTRSSFSARIHADALALAQQNENRLRGLNIDELSNLNQTFQSPKLHGVIFTLQETANYVSDATGSPSCTNPSADYLEATTTVTWPRMSGRKPVSVTSVLTPTVGSIDSGNGALAVSALNAAGVGYAGVNVAISGPTSASTTTTSTGCALFGDIPAGAYAVTVAPGVGTYVDSLTGAMVSAGVPDTRTVAVSAGSVPTSAPFSLDLAGSLTFSFTDAFPAGLSAPPGITPTAPGVVVFNTNMNAPSYRVCTLADSSGCPVVGAADTSFGAGDWGTGNIVATPLFPFTSVYSVYAGICGSNDPHVISGVTDPSAVVNAGANTNVSLTLPAMVVRLYSGTTVKNTQEIAMPANTSLTVTDNLCAVDYMSAPPSPLSAGDAVLPLSPTYVGGTANDTGLLKYPGMPYGNYTVCYKDAVGKVFKSTTANSGSGEIINLFAGSTAVGIC